MNALMCILALSRASKQALFCPKQIEDELLKTILRPPCVTCDRKPRALDKEAVQREALEFRTKAWHLLLDNLDVVFFLKQGERRQQGLRYPPWGTSLPPFHLFLLPLVLLDQFLQHFLQTFRVCL